MVGKGMPGTIGTPDSTPDAVAEVSQESQGLRSAVGVWGSYTWGYADVGADVYVALGIVMAAAEGATNVAFLFAGLVYVMVGLAYTYALAFSNLSLAMLPWQSFAAHNGDPVAWLAS